MNEISDYTAKILAGEDIDVQRSSSASTASFDIEDRVLTLPVWENMDPIFEDMLICHECSHAINTPIDYVSVVTENPKISSILNVVEDVRIERIFKEMYPGSKKIFSNAKNIINEQDILRIGDLDVASLNLIDRINIFYKCGNASGVVFSPEENVFVKRAKNTKQFSDVVELANDILQFMIVNDPGDDSSDSASGSYGSESTDTKTGTKSDSESTDTKFGSESTDTTSGTDSGSESTDTKSGTDSGSESTDTKSGTSTGNESYECLTANTFNSFVNDHLSTTDDKIYYLSYSEDYSDNIIVPYKTILNSLAELRYAPRTNNHVIAFNKEYNKQITYLYNQFELKKTAKRWLKKKTFRTGSLNLNRISQYKVSDNLFKTITSIENEKNHGLIMLLDWSGSMRHNNQFVHSLVQIVCLTSFCRMANIPFRVYGFKGMTFDMENIQKIKNYNFSDAVKLLEVFSSKMTAAEYNTMLKYVLISPDIPNDPAIIYKYCLGSTPLAPSILAMRKIIPDFQKEHKVNKTVLITYTDGENTTDIINIGSRFSRNKFFLHDTISKKKYRAYDKNRSICNNMISAIYKMLIDRYGIINLGFHITNDDILSPLRSITDFSGDVDAIYGLQKEQKEHGFCSFSSESYHKHYFVRPGLLIDKKKEVINLTENSSTIAIKNVIRHAGGKFKTKILIEKFIESIA